MQRVAATHPLHFAKMLTRCASANACAERHPIDRVAQAIPIPEHDAVALTAGAAPEFLAVYHRTLESKPGFSGGPHLSENGGVPLVDPNGAMEADGRVVAWLLAPRSSRRGTSPKRWLDDLAERFDGKPQVLNVILKAGTREARRESLLAAITDADDRHGVTSHPDAPVFGFR